MNGSSSLKSSTLPPLQPRRAQLKSWWGLWLKLSVPAPTFPRTWQLVFNLTDSGHEERTEEQSGLSVLCGWKNVIKVSPAQTGPVVISVPPATTMLILIWWTKPNSQIILRSRNFPSWELRVIKRIFHILSRPELETRGAVYWLSAINDQ